jgi:phosphomannomutase
MAIEAVAARYGGRVHRTAVGEANVVEKIRAVGAVIGGEGNGGVIYPALGLMRDASVAAALVTQYLASGASLAELAGRIPRFAILKSKLPLGSADLETLGRALMAEAPGGTLDRTDGVKVLWPDRWVHLRSSNTEPIMRLIAEARTPADAAALLDRARVLAGA